MTDPMPRETFYSIIDQARADKNPRGASADPDQLHTVLQNLDNDTLETYIRRWDEEMWALNSFDIWAVGYIANGGLSDDGFTDYRAWLIGKGQVVVDAVIQDPDNLADYLPEEDAWGEIDNEELGYVYLDILRERKIPIHRHIETPLETRGENFDEDEDELSLRYPRTAAIVDTWH